MEIYLDNSATTRVCPEAAEAAMRAMLTDYGNPSSTHAKGRAAAKLVMNARRQLAKALGCDSWEIAFTSCGSESDNWALWSGAESVSRKGRARDKLHRGARRRAPRPRRPRAARL